MYSFGGDLFGKCRRIAGHAVRFLGHHARRLVIAVSVAVVPLEPGDQHERPFGSNNAHHVPQHVLATPFKQCLFEPLREAVIDHARKVLLIDAVVLIGAQQLLGADQTERIE
jgi:hypothetical protein